MKKVLNAIETLIKTRPLGCCCALLLPLVALLLFAPSALKLIVLGTALLLLALSVLLLCLKVGAKSIWSFILALSIVLALSASSTLLSFDLFDKECRDLATKNETVTVTGYPTKAVYESEFSNCYLLKVQKLNGKRVFDVSILVCFSPADAPELFEIVFAEGLLSLPENHNPAFDSVSYYRSKGIFAQLHQTSADFTGKKAKTIETFWASTTAFFKSGIEKRLSEDSAPFVKAVLLGDKSDLAKEIKRDFSTLGISHLLAVSGLHLSALVALVTFLLLKLRIPLKIRCLLLIPAVLFFAALCGFSPSVTRAAIMLILFLLSKLVDEENDSFTALLFAAGLIVFFSPYAIFDQGFLLSFFATFGILLSSKLHFKKGKKEKKTKKLLKSVGNALVVSVFAQIAVLPVVCFAYGSTSLLSVPATLLFAPLITMILYLSPFALLCSFIPLLSFLTSLLLDGVVWITLHLSSFAVCFKEGLVSTEHFLLPFFLLLILALFLLLPFLKNRRLSIMLFLFCYLLFGTVCLLTPRFQSPQILMENDGKNDTMVFYDKGESLLVDLSDGSKGYFQRALHLLKENTGELHPDGILLTHYHQAHITTLSDLLKEYYLKTLYLSQPTNDTERSICDNLELLAKEWGVSVVRISEMDELTLGSYRISSLVRSYIKRSTHPILSFTVDTGCHRFTYLSSAGLEGDFFPEEQILFFGVHGPVTKERLDNYYYDRYTLLFANEELATLCGVWEGTVISSNHRRCLLTD